MTDRIALLGVPTALGGHLSGMAEAIALEAPVAGFGATSVTLANGDADATVDAIAALAAAALARPVSVGR